MDDEKRVQYKFMIPVSLKERLEEAAHISRRSLSAEIIARLDVSFMIDGEPTHDLIAELVSNVFENLVTIGALDPEKLERHYESRGTRVHPEEDTQSSGTGIKPKA